MLLLLRGLIYLLSLLDLRILYVLSDIIAFMLRHFVQYRKKIILENLYRSFPEKNEKEIELIAGEFYTNLSDVIVETIKLVSISEKELIRRCRFTNPEVLNQYFDSKKSLIAVCGHLNNWELGGQALSVVAPHKVLGVYKPLSDTSWDNYLKKIRSRFRIHLVPMKLITREVVKNKNTPTLTALIVDQTPHRDEINYRTTFLNQDTAVFLGTEKLAKLTGFPVIYFSMHRIRRGFYDITVLPVTEHPGEEPDYAITHKHLALLENDIRQQPPNWLWSHRRWKY
ncbi:MAG: lysophospholipid acyltransferase family protein [Bacteroidetes bacterium]|nr:lysophospholipid acyltransferase family protein [Bacteroidota bacterium]